MFVLSQGITPHLDHYDAFLIDLWGVTHDGEAPYPGVLEALAVLKEAGKRVIFLSNAPRRAASARQRIKEIGITPDYYDDIHTSGEETYHYLKKLTEEKAFRTCYHIGPDRDDSLFEGLGVVKTLDLDKAELIICSGTEHWEQEVTDFDEPLKTLLRRNVPMVCANADRVVLYQGKLALCSGAYAERYEAMGGEVVYFGKPHRAVYEGVLKMIGEIPLERVLAIGDSLHTDIQGAQLFEIASAFVCGGIHRHDLGITWGEMPAEQAILSLCQAQGVMPTLVLPAFQR